MKRGATGKRWSLLFVLVIGALCAEPALGRRDISGAIQFDRTAIYDEVAQLVTEHFYDLQFDQVAWDQQVSKFRGKSANANSHDEFSACLNELLRTLGASHTSYFSKLHPKRYQLLGIMHEHFQSNGDQDLFEYEGIGVDTSIIDGKTQVVSVYDGLPASLAGLRFADEILLVDGQPFHPILSFCGRSGETVEVQVRRAEKSVCLQIPVKTLDGRTMFETALQASRKEFDCNGRKIGYIHAWSYAGTKFQEQIRSMILWGELRHCDGLILDLRDGWGGADLNYVNLFREPIATIQSSSRTQPTMNFSGVWNRPIVLVTNRRSTSGKELFAFGFKKLGLGKIVGEPTAGAVLAGRCFLLGNGDILYLAVADIQVDGARLEGIGVVPDVVIRRQPSGVTPGQDSQLQAALQVLTDGLPKLP